jgi:beta-lactam-binding protein with PASTA domain
MAKKDFMSELAAEVEAQKRGERTDIDGINNFTPRRHPSSSPEVPEEAAEKTVQAPAEAEVEEVSEPVQKTSNYKADQAESLPAEKGKKEKYDTPDSFEEEELVPVNKPKRRISKPVKIGLIAGMAVLAAVLIYVFAVPKIIMPDFVSGTEYDHTLTGVSNWARQYSISSTSIATSDPEYSDTVDKGDILRQSVDPGTRIKTTTPITFTVSNGPDPDVEVDFPDIKSMTREEVDAWAEENHLFKYKATTKYDENVAEGDVISYEVKNGDEDSFTRSTTLNVVFSKGKAPVEQVTMSDFVGKEYAEAESWASTNKLTAVKTESYSETVDAGKIISQSVAANTTLDQGTSITFVVSKGKGVVIPNLVGYTAEQLDAWEKGNTSIVVVPTTIYNEAAYGTVLSQSVSPGTTIGAGEVLQITTSLYLPIVNAESDGTVSSQRWINQDYLALKAWVDECNAHGARLQAGEYGEFAERVHGGTFGQIAEIACYYGTSDDNNGCDRPLSLDGRIAYRIYDGQPTATPESTSTADSSSTSTAEATSS